MYVAYTIAILSLTSIVAMAAFRFWEIKNNKKFVFNQTKDDGQLGEALDNFADNASAKALKYLNKTSVILKKFFLSTVPILARRAGFGRIKSVVDGKLAIEDNAKSGASLFLKHIKEHRKGIFIKKGTSNSNIAEKFK